MWIWWVGGAADKGKEGIMDVWFLVFLSVWFLRELGKGDLV